MPGLNQLKRFNRDMLNFGDETAKRRARGEKPITVPIPANVKDADDSDDFVVGMPEGVSDMNGGVSMPQADASEVDVSDLLGGGTENADDIDFSQFEEPVGLDAPDGAGDGETASADNISATPETLTNTPVIESPKEDAPSAEDGGAEKAADEADFDELFGAEPLGSLDDLPLEPEASTAAEVTDDAPTSAKEVAPNADTPAADTTAAEVANEEESPIEEASPTQPEAANDADLFDDGGEINMNEGFPQGLDNVMPDAGAKADSVDEGTEQSTTEDAARDGGTAAQNDGAPLSEEDDFNVDDLLSGIDFGDGGAGDAVTPSAAEAEPAAEESPSEATPVEVAPSDNIEKAPDSILDRAGAGEVFPASPEDEVAPTADGLPDEVATAESALSSGKDDSLNADDLLSGLDLDDGGAGDAESEGTQEASPIEVAPETDAAGAEESSPAGDEATPAEVPLAEESAPVKDDDSVSDVLSGLDFNMDDGEKTGGIDINDALAGLDLDDDSEAARADGSGEQVKPSDALYGGQSEATPSDDTSDSGFELDDDALHIPGYTDTDTADDVHAKSQDADAGADSGENKGLPPNTLTDAQYDKFKGNLAEYPLNVRQAFENMVVQNEFTDDAQFEVVNKVLKKSSARHVASHLEKMLDINIPVPRDYERRTASEYAAYKSSFKYQLYNRIIPAALVCLAGVLLAIGLFMFCRKFVYRPIMANRLYKQGYALLESDEYPQSESRFAEASRYKMVKKWFYRYAHGYQDHKQYQRAEKMYRNILYCFNHDKQAGIEYARMECDDLANYEKAEQIARREVLDYHINDPDGILLLGDVFLTWATEKDPSKFEDAKAQYALLMQLYGPNDMYMSRMMRYFIRTDNLREVLPLKEHFYTSKKAQLDAQDWTELSGFMLDKLYGPLSPLDEELRIQIADVMDMLQRAVNADPDNPVAMYNLSRYFVKRNSSEDAKTSLTRTIELFDTASSRGSRDMYKELDAYRLLGEEYSKSRDYIKAQEIYTDGITLYEKENRGSGFMGDKNVGTMYADAGDIDYFIRGNMSNAFNEYTRATETNFDTPSLRYRLGYIHYNQGDYDGAINSFIKAAEENHDDMNLLLAMGNTLSLRGDNYGAQSYYERLVSELDTMRTKLFPQGILFPQVRSDQAEIVDMYLKASNNLGVTLNRLARHTGNSRMNADAMVNLTTSMRAWDALTRNQTTMVRMPGSNLAEQNLQYMTRTASEFEPAIYTDIPKILTTDMELHQ